MNRLAIKLLFFVFFSTCFSTVRLYASGIAVPGFFIKNTGQFDGHYDYCLKTTSSSSYFRTGEVIHKFLLQDVKSGETDPRIISLDIQFKDYNEEALAVEKDSLPGKFNFFFGRDSTKWKTNVSSFQTLVYADIYHSIDLVYHATNQFIENDFVVHPGGRIEDIVLVYKGIQHISVNQQGELDYQIDGFKFKEVIPEVYQMIKGRRVTVGAKFIINNNGDVSYDVEKYNPAYDLIIDPQLIYCTYFGGSGDDYFYHGDIAKDLQGNIYFTGRTSSLNFPVSNGSYSTSNTGMLDAVVVKLNPTGTQILFSTYIGSSGNDLGFSLELSGPNNDIVIAGDAGGNDFPVTAGAYQTVNNGGLYDGFILKLNNSGNSLLFSTFIGGTDEDQCIDLRLDAAFNIYVVGQTASSNYPTTYGVIQSSFQGAYDAFISELSSNGSTLIKSTLLGGPNYDRGYAIALDNSGYIYLIGSTEGSFPVVIGSFDVTYNGGSDDIFICKLNPSLSVLSYSTYLGGSGQDRPLTSSIVLDVQNQVILSGKCGPNFPTTSGAYSQTFAGGLLDAFIVKINSSGTSLVYSSYIGGSGDDYGTFITSDNDNNVLISGYAGLGFPTTPCGYDITFNGGISDGFIAKFNSNASELLYSTYFGGNNTDNIVAMWLNADTVTFLGETLSSNLPVSNNAFDLTFNGGGHDMFLAKLQLIEGSAIANAGPDATICYNSSYTIANSSASNYSSLLWSTPGTGVFSDPTILHPVYFPSLTDIQNGSVTLTLTVTPSISCAPVSDGMILYIDQASTAYAGPDAVICQDNSYTLNSATSSNASSYFWTSSGTGTFNNPYLLNPIYTPSEGDVNTGSIILTLNAISNLSCGNASDAMVLNIFHQSVINAGPDDTICELNNYQIIGASAQFAASYHWTTSGSGTFNNPNILDPIYYPGTNDIINGSVILTLNANSISPCNNVSDALTLNIVSQAFVNAGQDANMCEASGSYQLSGSTAQNTTAILWTTSGTGTFNNVNALNPIYTPSIGDIESGSVLLTETGYSFCGNVSDAMVLNITRQAAVNAGPDATICKTPTFLLNLASSQFATSYQWTTNGSGTFNNPNLLNPIYTPSANDIQNGSVLLIINATSVSPCVGVSDAMVLTIIKEALVYAGPDDHICESAGSYLLNGATAQYASSFFWTTSGTGTFNDATILNPVYTPSLTDINAGSVKLTETSGSACGIVVDSMMLFISRQAIVNAGTDAIICENDTYSLNSASSQQALSYQWNSTGDGSFSNPATLNPVYTPGANDILTGLVTLSVNSESMPFCLDTSDSMLLKINRKAYVNAGYNDTICNWAQYEISDASASGYSNLLWSHNGLGVLSNINSLNPRYTPAVNESGEVVFTLKATGLAPCSDAIDQKHVVVNPSLIVVPPGDLETCEMMQVEVKGLVVQNNTSCLWTTSGSGIFDDPTLLSPKYSPGESDVSNGKVTLSFRLSGQIPCSDFESNITLTIFRNPLINAGKDSVICENNVFRVNDAIASNVTSILWDISPASAGLLTGETSLSPVFTPVTGYSGLVHFRLTAAGNVNCGPEQVTDELSLQLIQAPEVDAGLDQTIPESKSIRLSGSANGGSGFYSWVWEPMELLVDPFIENPLSIALDNDVSFLLSVVDQITGCQGTDSVSISTYHTAIGQLEIFNIITPNRDNKNDSWIIGGIEEFPDNSVTILNRWGDKIQEFTRYDNSTVVWDGTNSKDELVPDGTYYYVLSVKNKGTRTGWIYVQGEHK